MRQRERERESHTHSGVESAVEQTRVGSGFGVKIASLRLGTATGPLAEVCLSVWSACALSRRQSSLARRLLYTCLACTPCCCCLPTPTRSQGKKTMAAPGSPHLRDLPTLKTKKAAAVRQARILGQRQGRFRTWFFGHAAPPGALVGLGRLDNNGL